MTYTAHDPRTFYAAIDARLTSTINVGGSALSVGTGEAPADAATRTPYAVRYVLAEDDDPEARGDLADPHRGTLFSWQITSVGKTEDEVLWLMQKVRAALLGWTPSVSGLQCSAIEKDGGDRIARDDGVQPPLFRGVDTFTCFAS